LPTGGSPAATSFLCFAKEKEAKKGDRTVTALRVPVCASQKMGNVHNSLRSNKDISDPFSASHKWQRQKRNS
jgi:hypothetical protein